MTNTPSDRFRMSRRGFLRAARHHEIGQRKIGIERARHRVEGRARHAGLLRLGPERGHEAGEGGVSGRHTRDGQNEPDQYAAEQRSPCCSLALLRQCPVAP